MTDIESAIMKALEPGGFLPSRIVGKMPSFVDVNLVRPTLAKMVRDDTISFILGRYCRHEDAASIVETSIGLLERQARKFGDVADGERKLVGVREHLNDAKARVAADRKRRVDR